MKQKTLLEHEFVTFKFLPPALLDRMFVVAGFSLFILGWVNMRKAAGTNNKS